jgi:hypothetical protein
MIGFSLVRSVERRDRAVAVFFEHFGNRRGAFRYHGVVAGKRSRPLCDRAETDLVVIPAGKQRGSRWQSKSEAVDMGISFSDSESARVSKALCDNSRTDPAMYQTTRSCLRDRRRARTAPPPAVPVSTRSPDQGSLRLIIH